jgi:outer membrane protein OmpA-like peptidoglycan-associated protein
MLTRRMIAVQVSALLTACLSARSEAQEHGRFYRIYFRWNSAEVRPNMQKVVFEAAQYAKYYGSSRIEVTGYTDTSMSDAESLDISIRMAQAVADELMKHGVGRDILIVQGMGEENLAETTTDGVITPKNRRVEINIR